MVDISRNYINETLRQFEGQQIAEDARKYYLDKIMNFAEELAENTNLVMKNRRGKKIMKKDVKLAAEVMM